MSGAGSLSPRRTVINEPDPHVIWLTDVDGWEHAIGDEEATRGMRTGRGTYESLCRRAVVAAPLVAPPGRQCPGCLRLAAANGDAPPRRAVRRGWAVRRTLRAAHAAVAMAMRKAVKRGR